MKKRIIFIAGACLLSCMLLAGCNKKSDLKDTLDNETAVRPDEDKPEGNNIVKDENDDAVPDGDLNLNGKDVQNEIDLTSEDLILEFLEGEWTMIDRNKREDFATFRIRNNGAFDFIRNKDDASGSGRLHFAYSMADADEEPDSFSLEFDDLDELVPEGRLDYPGSGGPYESSGIFHIGIGEDRDYLYLKEIGNGDTMISLYALNVVGPDDYENWTPAWLFYRDKAPEAVDEAPDADRFYAWAWERDSDGIWLQPMTLHEYDTEDEYTGRRYRGGYFTEKEDIRSVYYRISDRVELNGLLEADKWSREYPLMMYEVSLDNKGRVAKVNEVDQSYYNIYDLGDIDPEFSYEGTKITINGHEMDIQEYAPAANAIMDCTRVGDWIIVECHVNPHTSLYEFYNINSGDFEYDIAGANLTWLGDDLSTAVYSDYNQIFDFWGKRIGQVDEGEVYGLEWLDEETVGAECRIIDGKGTEKEYTYKVEYRPQDKAVLTYYEYLLGGSRQWRRFRDEMPDGAAALVIVNPPSKLLDKMPPPQVYDEGAYDRMVVVSLMDGMRLHVDSNEPDENGREKYWGRLHDVNRGDATVFEITVPEGLPNGTLVVRTPNSGEVLWDITQISGRDPVMSKFLTM